MKTKMIAEFLGNSERTILRWKEENRPVVNFLEKYFPEQYIEEFLNTGKIEKLELIKDLSAEEIKELKTNQNKSQAAEQIAQKLKEIDELRTKFLV
jgi:predicted flavoprotein YhiN